MNGVEKSQEQSVSQDFLLGERELGLVKASVLWTEL